MGFYGLETKGSERTPVLSLCTRYERWVQMDCVKRNISCLSSPLTFLRPGNRPVNGGPRSPSFLSLDRYRRSGVTTATSFSSDTQSQVRARVVAITLEAVWFRRYPTPRQGRTETPAIRTHRMRSPLRLMIRHRNCI